MQTKGLTSVIHQQFCVIITCIVHVISKSTATSVRRMKPLKTTFQLGLWPAFNDVWHY